MAIKFQALNCIYEKSNIIEILNTYIHSGFSIYNIKNESEIIIVKNNEYRLLCCEDIYLTAIIYLNIVNNDLLEA